ncbi:MAG TPA: DUF192 domain-containing protein [Xanthobacteraceae bacterium]|nr:DUF192 domain-containing protein [Xanthobacteraceae bacterium]
MKIFRVAAIVATAFFLAAAPALAQQFERVEIVSKSGVHVFDVEMAVTPQQRSTGLMHRKELAPGRGMLFDFEGEGPISMWMKNTYVSLDMIFIRADGRIARIAESTTPLSEQTIPSGAPVKAVLEVVAGTAKRLGIAPGDRVAHRIFRKR